MNRLTAITFLFFILSGWGQQKNELKSLIASDAIPEDKIEHLLQLSTLYRGSHIDSSMYFTMQAQKFADDLHNDSINSRLRAHKAAILIIQQQFMDAEKLLLQNVDYTAIDSLTYGETILNLGSISYYKQDLEQAVGHYLEASKIFERYDDTVRLGKVYSNIGGIQAQLKNPEKAIFYLKKALSYSIDNELLRIQVLANLSGAYNENGSMDKAIAAALETEKLAIANNAIVFLGLIYSNLCNIYLENKEYNPSIKYGLEGLKYKRQLHQNTDIVLNNLGYAHLQLGNSDKALYYFKQVPLSANGELRSLLYNNLRKTHENIGNYKEALRYAKDYNALQDSLHSLSQRQNVEELIEKYESEKKQQQIDLLNTKDELNRTQLKEQRNFIWGLAIFSFLVIALGFLLYRNQRTTLSLQKAKIQHRLLQTQLNPHFLFHALSSIQGFIYQNKKEESASYLSSFSKLMRSILNSSDQEFIPVTEDINALTDYLHLQKLHVDTSFEKKIVVDEVIDDDLLIPPMFTQPFVENAILHGIKNVENGVIRVAYKIENDSLLITIQDNGKGFKENPADANTLHRSMSMEILNKRVQNLKQTHKYHCQIAVKSSKEGSKVTLRFPLRYKKL